jgi:hypothetical protein
MLIPPGFLGEMADERRRVKAIRQGGRIRDTYGARIYGATVPVASRARTGRIYYAPNRRQWRVQFFWTTTQRETLGGCFAIRAIFESKVFHFGARHRPFI